ncbi:hypothetical protein [Micromonospora sp. NPDC023633]|uniref:hypothetical protein n=1 Tax=Micromonospora sp. NPDC023633 TaxID=3154320 RepID=UPI0033D8DDBB
MTRTEQAAGQPDDLTALADAIRAVADLPPLDRFPAIADLSVRFRSVVKAEQDRAVYEATQEHDYQHVADALNIAYSNVNNRVTAHRARTGEPTRRGRRVAPGKQAG